ncbi:hypothetical protein KC318_g8047, partial [Hortaea werneckii]
PLSPSNYTYYPWTLPSHLIPADAVSALIRQPLVSTLTFPNLNPPNEKSAGGKAGTGGGGAAGNWLEEKGFLASSPPLGALQKVLDGVLVHSLSNLRLNLVQEVRRVGGGGSGEEPYGSFGQGGGGGVEGELQQEFRVNGVGNLPLGRDEKVLVSGRALDGVSPVDPHFRRVRDLEMLDLVVDVPVLGPEPGNGEEGGVSEGEASVGSQEEEEEQEGVAVEVEVEPDEPENGTMESFWKEVESLLSGFLPSHLLSPHHQHRSRTGDDDSSAPFSRTLIPAILPTGLGAAPLPPSIDSSSTDDLLDPAALPLGSLPFQSIFYLDSTLCPPNRLPASIAKTFSILVLRRGECSFSDKLAAIPSFPPSSSGLQLVVVLSTTDTSEASTPGSGPAAHQEQQGEIEAEGRLIRPLLDTPQRSPAGFERRYPIAMVMVDASSAAVVDVFRRAAAGRGGFDDRGVFWEESGRDSSDGGGEGGRGGAGAGSGAGGLAVKRRYWFESLGVPIGNLIML